MGSDPEGRRVDEVIPPIDVGGPAVRPLETHDVQIDVASGEREYQAPRIRNADWWRGRRRDYLRDRQALCRIVAIGIVVIAVINVVPGLLYWRSSLADWEPATLGRWFFLQIFISAWLSLYAPLVIQVCHWAALRAVAVAAAGASLVWGMAAAGLRIGGPAGTWATWLQLPASIAPQASLWCLAMLSLCLIVVYLAGRESQRWQRVELLMGRVAPAA